MGRRLRRSRQSPAIVVAALALVAAVAGTALAGPQATTSAISKKKVKKIARKQIEKLAAGLSVAHADTAGTANNAESAGTANTATQAQNAATANGVRPVKINFAAPANTAPRTFVNRGGIRITGECLPAGFAQLFVASTANNGVAKVDTVNAGSPPGTSTFAAPDFDVGGAFTIGTSGFPNNLRTLTINYRGAGGTEVTGDLVTGHETGAGQCVITGTLFVS